MAIYAPCVRVSTRCLRLKGTSTPTTADSLATESLVFSDYIAQRLADPEDGGFGAVFSYVEDQLTDKDTEVGNAVATCFLENLLNRTPDVIPPGRLVPLLGPRSREFCRAWDEFCGVRTDGPWTS